MASEGVHARTGASFPVHLPPFDYSQLPISAGEIRILTLCPAATESEVIRIELHKYDFNRLPHFSALSYTWGAPEFSSTILVGKQAQLAITPTLETALKALRLANEKVLLWVDQICLNQANEDEKATQIPHMGLIYSLSSQTIGWIGPATTHSNLAIDYLQRVGVRAQEIGLGAVTAHQLRSLLADDEDFVAGTANLNQDTAAMRTAIYELAAQQGEWRFLPATEGIIELCQLDYFKRGWIQQEIAIPTSLTFKWGSKTIDADILRASVVFHIVYSKIGIQELRYPPEEGLQQHFPLLLRAMARGNRLTDFIHESLTLRTWFHLAPSPFNFSIAGLIERCSRLKFTEGRDRVYGILGMARDQSSLGLEVNFTQPWERVFSDVTKRIVQMRPCPNSSWAEGLAILTLVRFPGRNNALPSWTPDFSSQEGVKPLSAAADCLSVPYNTSAQAVHEVEDCRQHAVGPDVLLCRGIIVDRITHVGRPWKTDAEGQWAEKDGIPPLDDMAEFAARSAALIASNPDSDHPFRSNAERLLEAEWRVPVLDRESVGSTGACRRASDTVSKVGYERARYSMLFSREAHDIYGVIANIPVTADEAARLGQVPESERPLLKAQMITDKAMAFRSSTELINYDNLMDEFKARRGFIGELGFMGVGPLDMETGDLVCVIFGGKFPFVLRETSSAEGGEYRLIGEAYCDGIMDGELTMKRSPQDFRLV